MTQANLREEGQEAQKRGMSEAVQDFRFFLWGTNSVSYGTSLGMYLSVVECVCVSKSFYFVFAYNTINFLFHLCE